MKYYSILFMLSMGLLSVGCIVQPRQDLLPTATGLPTGTTIATSVLTSTPDGTPTLAMTLTTLQEHQLIVMKAVFPDYNGPQDVCNWSEIEIKCDEQGYITKLQIGPKDVTSLPPEIGQLSHLEYLWVFDNQLATLPPEIGQLSSLRFLSLVGNPLVSLPSEISNLSNLEDLQLSGDQLGLLEHVSQIPNLKTLAVLPANEPTIIPPEIGMLASLELLKLNNQKIQELPPEIGKLTNLQTLDVSANLLTTLPSEIIKLTNLRYLDVSANPLTSLPLEICTKLKSAIYPAELCP